MATSNRRFTMQGLFGLFSRLNRPVFQSLGLFLLALLPRLAALGRYVTPDEPIWIFRSLRFREALLAADWAATIQSGHPGVTLTWLGAIAIQLQLWFQPQSGQHLTWLNRLYWLSPDNGPAFQHLAVFMTAARLGPIILTSLGLVAVYCLLRSRFSQPTAGLGTLLLIGDPFTAGLSGLFHLDALLSTFMLLAVLIILPRSQQNQTAVSRREAVLSGAFTALAVLTKTPGLFLLPFVSLIILWRTLSPGTAALPFSSRLGRLPAPFFYWGGTILIIILLLLPAVWAAPTTVFETVTGLANRLADSAVRPIFFLGEETLNPGPAFYPLVLAFRLSPAVCIGLLLSAVFALKRFGKSLNNNLTWLLLFSLAFLFFLNLSAKRFDRYALPAILPLILVSAVGLKTMTAKLQNPPLLQILMPLLMLSQILYLITFFTFPLTAYNWLVGGPAVAADVFAVGWGEGTSVAAKWLAENIPDSSNQTLFTSNIPAAAAFFPGQLLPLQNQSLTRLQSDNYVLFDPQDWQTTAAAEQTLLSLAFGRRQPLKRFDFNAFTGALVFTNLEPADLMLPVFQSTPQQIHFADQVAIHAAGALPATWPNPIQFGIEWERLQTAETNYFYRLELVDQAGESWLAQEGPLLNAVDHLVQYWPLNEPQELFYLFYPPGDLAPGIYTIQATLFDDQNARIGAFLDDGRFAGVTIPLVSLTIPAPADQLPPEPPNPINNASELIGFADLPAHTETGLPIKLNLWWRQLLQTPESGQLQLSIGEETIAFSLSTAGWLHGQYYQIRPGWRVPPGLNSGSYPISLQWLDENGRAQWPSPILLGQIEVVARPRSFELPEGITPLNIQLGSLAYLQQALAEVSDGGINLDVIWQAVEPDGRFYTTFVHLIDAAGKTVTQGDRPSFEPTNSWAAGQVIQEQYRLIGPPSGRYTITIGFYDQTNGLRLPVYAADGRRLAGDQYSIEVIVP